MIPSKELKRKLVRFYNTYGEVIDPILDAKGKGWDDVSLEDQKAIYKQVTGEEA